MTPKFDKLYVALMENLSQQGKGNQPGKGMLATRGGGSTTPQNNVGPTTQAKPTTGQTTPVANISGQPATTPANGQQQDFGQLLNEPDDNKAAESVMNYLTTNKINFNDPNFAKSSEGQAFTKSPEGQAIGQRISQNPKFKDALNNALNNAQAKMAQTATANTQKVFANQQQV